MSFTTRTTLSALVGAVAVAAHGHVNHIVVNGVKYAGYDVTSMPYQSNPPVVVGWSTTATDNGFVSPSQFGSEDIICHRDAKNAGGHATVAAGDSVFIQWDTWPESHKGPVLDYLASCGDAGCETVDKTALEFFKISEVGLVDGSTAPGTYGDDLLMKNGNGWMVKVPENIAPGAYVLRHEMIALHSGGQEDGAQSYPQCFNLVITGSGTEVPQGVKGTELYKADDEGILFNIYTTLSDYPIPGPALIAGASAINPQVSSAAASTGTPTVGSGSGNAPAPAPTGASTSAAAEAPAPTSAVVSSPAPTAVATTTTAAPEPTSAPEEPANPPSTCTKKARRSKKVRRHVRDVKARNVAPLRRVPPVRA